MAGANEKSDSKATRRAFMIGFLATVLFYGSCQKPTEQITSASTETAAPAAKTAENN